MIDAYDAARADLAYDVTDYSEAECVPFYEDWAYDIRKMHEHYGANEVVRNLSPEKLRALLAFRYRFMVEEMKELRQALIEGNVEEIIDAYIDLDVVGTGTIDLFDVDVQKAWLEVLRANMAKKTGVKEGRPNPLGLPDLIKPEGWVAPSHKGNHGFMARAFEDGGKIDPAELPEFKD